VGSAGIMGAVTVVFDYSDIRLRMVYMLGYSAMAFVLAILLLLMKEPERGQSEEVMKEVKKVTVSQIMSLFKNREYMLACLGYIFYTFAMGAFSYFKLILFLSSFSFATPKKFPPQSPQKVAPP
jgi:Na+/melibiose symporter-like transporter